MRLLDSIETDKRERQIKQVTLSDSESIFDLIETSSPFDEDRVETHDDDAQEDDASDV